MKKIYLLALLCFSPFAMSDAVPFSDFKFIDTGMSEGEVLYRIGVPDHETIQSDFYHNIIRKTWFYIPEKRTPSSKRWISEVTFDFRGNVSNVKRYRP